MVGLAVSVLADGLSGEQRLQLVAALLGVLVFGAVVLVVERRNQGHEVTPPGMTPRDTSRQDPRPAPRQVYRPPAQSVPTLSARTAADAEPSDHPYPVPFVSGAGTESEPPAPAEAEEG